MDFTIRTMDDLCRAVQKYGILPFFANSIKGFSIEENCAPEAFFSNEPGVWEWKGPVIEKTGCAYGKFFAKKAAFISFRWYPDFCNWRRDGYDFDARFDDGLASYNEQYLYNLIAGHYSVLSKDLKIEGGYAKPRTKGADSWEPRKGFDTLITRLQMEGYVTTVNFEYEQAKNGEFYGWGLARYAIAEKHFGKKFTDRLYQRTPQESYDRIFRHLKKILPGTADNEIEYFLKHK
jgi:hypothetical protein